MDPPLAVAAINPTRKPIHDAKVMRRQKRCLRALSDFIFTNKQDMCRRNPWVKQLGIKFNLKGGLPAIATKAHLLGKLHEKYPRQTAKIKAVASPLAKF
jgi:hypothetical protein